MVALKRDAVDVVAAPRIGWVSAGRRTVLFLSRLANYLNLAPVWIVVLLWAIWGAELLGLIQLV
jgi:hypothetical protein